MGACISGTRWTQAGLSQMLASRRDPPKYTKAEQNSALSASSAIIKITGSICVNPWNPWLKIFQSKMNDYAKQTQFPKNQNELKLLFNKGLWKQAACRYGQNKANTNPIQSQYKANTNPIPEKPKMNENLFATKVYENITAFGLRQNKPNSNPIKPNFRGSIYSFTEPSPNYWIHLKNSLTVRPNSLKCLFFRGL